MFALANSGGGILVFGLDETGKPSGEVEDLIDLDPSVVADRIYAYTNQHFGQLEILVGEKTGHSIVAVWLGRPEAPLVAVRPGMYPTTPGKQERAFSVGVAYFRHSAKSEPGTTDDLRLFIDSSVAAARDTLLSGVTKVFQAPVGSQFVIASSDEDSAAVPGRLRLTDASGAQDIPVLDPSKTHPYRMNDLVKEVNRRLPRGVARITTYDVRVALAVFNLNDEVSLTYRPDYGPQKYSPAFADWLLRKLDENPYTLLVARSQYRRMSRSRKKK